MILVFLGNWKSTLIIAASIPLSILVSVLCLSALGETINIMTLGGLALAVGILVDDATVEIENINRNLAMGKETVQAILDGAQQIAVPAFVSTLCICIVFIPMFFLSGVAKFLFVPLAEAVIFAMLASYMWSRTIVPTMAMYLSERRGRTRSREGPPRISCAAISRSSNTRSNACAKATATRCAARWPRPFCLPRVSWHFACFPRCWFLFWAAIFSLTSTPGQIRLHFRARTGLRIEETARLADQVDGVIRQTIPQGEVETVLDNLGVPYSGINLSYSNAGTFGTADGEILVQLKGKREKPTGDVHQRLAIKIAADFSGRAIFLSARRHRHADSEFWRACAHRYSGHRVANQQGNYVIGEKLAERTAAHSRRRRRTRAASLRPTHAAHGHRSHPRTEPGTAGQGRGAKSAGVAKLQLSDRTGVLARSQEWRQLQRRGANAAIPGGYLPSRCKILRSAEADRT